MPELKNDLYPTLEKKKSWAGEVLNKRKDGSDFPVLLSLSPLLTDIGELVAIVGITHDITERKFAEAEIKKTNEALIKLNAEKDKFFSIVAHDLRSPFNAFLGFTEMMVEDLPSMTLSEIQHIARLLKNSANNLYNLLENLLQWSRIQRGLVNPDTSPLLLRINIAECMQLIMESANKKGIEIINNIPEGLVVFADLNMFESIFRNLVSNAVKFTPKGGKITISAKSTNDNLVEICIKDTGIGMNKDLLHRLFRIDEQTNRKGTEGEPSTGLGLIICKDFVEKHGGKIWVESDADGISGEKGSTFYFTIPG